MAWYRTGTVTVTNGSTTVTGASTAWVANVGIGEGLLAPDGRIYEITEVVSNTSLKISPAYLGATQSAQAYTIVPTQSYIRDLAAQAADLVNRYDFSNWGQDFGKAANTSQALQKLGLDNLGTAATKDVGESSGNVMAVGAFGWGLSSSATPYADLNELGRTGIYRVTLENNPELPEGFTGGNTAYHNVLATRVSSTTMAYLTLSAGNSLYRGYLTAGGSLYWHQLLDSNNLGISGKKLFYAEDLAEVALTTSVLKNGNVGYGSDVFRSSPSGNESTAFGHSALREMTDGYGNTAFGRAALRETTTGFRNTAVGLSALQNCSEGSYNSALGWKALSGTTDYTNCTGIGREAEVTGSYQIQLGHPGTTVYAYGAVQDRSDRRDKTDIRDTQLGLTFVNALRPVDYRWDMRDDYRPAEPEYPAEPELETFMPAEVDEASFGDDEEALNLALQTYEQAKQQAELDFEQAYDAWRLACKPIRDQWIEDCKLGNIVTDGTHKRNRYHHGLIADEVKQVMDNLGLDFGGYQDHSINGGDDVLSIGYAELIAPMIKAIQELSAKVEALENQNE